MVVGDIAEVSGFVTADADIVATRIEIKPAGSQFAVRDIVSGLDTNTLRFSINARVVAYSAATPDDFPSSKVSCPANNRWITVILSILNLSQYARNVWKDGRLIH